MTKLSVAVATFNEEARIASCLRSVAEADEVIIIDGRSSDKTAQLAKKLGAKVFVVDNEPLMKKNMNLAFEKCTGDWILSLDADEKVSAELMKEIKTLLETENITESAFKMPRKNIIFGKWIANTFWYPDYQLRLFKRGQAKFPALNVHEELVINGEIGTLVNHIEHTNYETVSEFVLRLDKYTSTEAEKIIKEKRKIVWSDAIRFPLSEFLTRFFSQKGYLDGLHGLVLSILQAFYWEVIFAKVWESQGFWQYGDKNFLTEVGTEVKELSRQFNHWAVISQGSRAKKIIGKVKNKARNYLSL